MLRLFFGLPVGAAASAALAAACENLELPPAWRRTPMANWHLTLAFLGATDEAQLPALVALGERACAGHAARSGRLDRLGWLPNAHRPALLAALAADAVPFAPLHQTVKQGARELGFAIESRPLLPHVTLARGIKGRAAAALPAVTALQSDIELPIAELVLYRSEYSPKGQLYRPLWRAALTGA